MMNLTLRIIFVQTSKGFLTCKILRHGTNGIISPPNGGMLRIASPLKFSRLQLGFDFRTLVKSQKVTVFQNLDLRYENYIVKFYFFPGYKDPLTLLY
jgi:hypothetical protein